KSEAVIVQASSGIPESKPRHLSRIVIPDRLHSNIIKSRTHFVQASSGISSSQHKHFIKSKLNIDN
ncbi:MAG: hypothetical protein SGI89_03875, partial [bacterium]|nr:hypothetical protein [bacterium]